VAYRETVLEEAPVPGHASNGARSAGGRERPRRCVADPRAPPCRTRNRKPVQLLPALDRLPPGAVMSLIGVAMVISRSHAAVVRLAIVVIVGPGSAVLAQARYLAAGPASARSGS